MRPGLVVVVDVLLKHTFKMSAADDDQPVEAFPASRYRPNAPRRRWRRPSTTDGSETSRRFRVVHPFHPLSGREFELVSFAHTWGEHRVFFRVPGEDRVRAMPAAWTDVEGVDPYLVRLSSSRWRSEVRGREKPLWAIRPTALGGKALVRAG